jgi:hypothetical protein
MGTNSESLFSKPSEVNRREYVPAPSPKEEPANGEGRIQASEKTSLELSPMRKEEVKKAMARQVKHQLGK